MRSVLVDKIASVAVQADLGQEIRVSPDIPCEEGVLIAVEVLNNKSRYNTIELTSGRMAEVKKGDVVVGALGHRKALFGYSGHLPTELKPGDIVQLLNLGGVIGICDSINPSHGDPFNCKVLGCVLDFPVSRPARRRAGARLDGAAEARRAARHARRARRRDRRHLHELRQDGRRLRDRQPLPPQRPRRRRVQVDGRRAAPRHPGHGGLGRAPHRDVLGLRHLRDDVEERAGADALAVERAVGREARRDRVRARRRAARRLRRRGDPARQGDRRDGSRRWCSAPTIPSARGAARSCCARSSASSRPSSRARPRTIRSASTSSGSARTSPR